MESKHTPGPWTLSLCNRQGKAGQIDYHPPHDARRVQVAYAYNRKSDMHVGEAIANARLIESAPDLLEALKFIAKATQDIDSLPMASTELVRKTALEAIAKATKPA